MSQITGYSFNYFPGRAKPWMIIMRRHGFGYVGEYFQNLQDAYAWLFRCGVFDQRNPFDNHAISGAKEEG